ncbi:MAG: DUF4011 domain-containing protein [Pyrinomonadaceae bacterium]|nr:DUF4011 domain-containing protein [Phycisphaerales bacterium]
MSIQNDDGTGVVPAGGVAQQVEKLRTKLLDLTGRNPLISFKHGSRNRRHIRVIDELPDQLYAKLESDAPMRFRSLGEEDDGPADERTIVFKRALDAAKLEDDEYLRRLSELGADPGDKAVSRLEQELRTRLRDQLGMPPRGVVAIPTPAEAAQRRGLDPSFDLPVYSPEAPTTKHADSVIQTLLFSGTMETTLARLRDQVRLSVSETGVNPLFCVFGFIEWYEDDSSEAPLHAPLLLYPLELERELVRGHFQYTVRSSGEGAMLNVAIAERFKRDFQIVLPEVPEGSTPEQYFATIQNVLEPLKNWKLRRWATIGLFSFARIAMYHDLDPKHWQGVGGLDQHPPISRLIDGSGGAGAWGARETSSETDDLDDRAELEVPLVSDADSSQLAAVRAVLAGQSLVIEGPPGTGKSQTITNIIAAAMAAGKTVLFLAEKNAALNVVKSRLERAGLQDFCLELHSTKAGRKETARTLAARLNRRRPRNVELDLLATLKGLQSAKLHLWQCAQGLSQPAGSLGISTHDLLWRSSRIRERTRHLPDDIDTLELPQALSLTEVDLARIVIKADSLEQVRHTIAGICGSQRRHPWYGVASAELNLLQCEELVRKVRALSDAARLAAGVFASVHAATGWEPAPLSALRSVLPLADIPAPAEEADEQIIGKLADRDVLSAMKGFVESVQESRRLRTSLRTELENPDRLDSLDPHILHRFADAVAAGDLQETLIGELAAMADRQERDAAMWDTLHALMSEVVLRTGYPDPLHAGAEQWLVAAVSLAGEALPAIAGARSPSLLAPGALDGIRQSGARLEGLRQRRAALRASFAIDTETDSAGLLAHARALRSAPPIPMLSWGWWKARARFKGLCVSPLKVNRNQMATHLEEIARYIDDSGALVKDESLRSLFGRAFHELDTDVEAAATVAAWADKVRSLIPSHESAGVLLKKMLYECPVSQLEALAALATHPQFGALQKAARASDDGAATIDARRLASRAAREAATLAPSLGVRPDRPAGIVITLATGIVKLRFLNDEVLSSKVAAGVLGASFQGSETDLQSLIASIRYVQVVSQSDADKRLLAFLLHGSARQRWNLMSVISKDAGMAQERVTNAIAQLGAVCPVDYRVWISAQSPLETNPAELADHAGRCASDPEGLQMLVDHERLVSDLRGEGFGPTLAMLDATGKPVKGLGEACRRVAYQSLVKAVLTERPALASFSGHRIETFRSQFRSLDRTLQKLRQGMIEQELHGRSIDQGSDAGSRKEWTGLAVVKLESEKQRAHVTVRDLLDRGGRAVQQLMPCFMMSPLSVAQYLKPGVLQFDLVIMDEASQLRPEDAIGGIARASQVVIVGDPKQLPPTNFFDRGDTSVEEEDEGTAVDEKSILDLSLSIMPMRRLTWHYRSTHPALIAFSNREFYESKLVVFPSPRHGDATLGVRYVHVPEGRYNKSVNPPEVKRVGLAAVEHARLFPGRSLGIVTLNKQQAELLSLELDGLAAEHPEFEEWRKKWEGTLEPFFVKNLENVQGDERDCIFISTVYGKDQGGTLHQRFGPINNQGGHRRLNVLFTRAKCQTTIFSTMDPDEIRADESSPWGVRALKGFLAFAKAGTTETPMQTGREMESDFEIAVAEVLRARGFDVVPHVGASGYFIDLAVRHPVHPGEFVLGIECDGATYHSIRSARDRDRLRQEVLERLHWRIHRIWSLDWYRNPDREQERLLAAVAAATLAANA